MTGRPARPREPDTQNPFALLSVFGDQGAQNEAAGSKKCEPNRIRSCAYGEHFLG